MPDTTPKTPATDQTRRDGKRPASAQLDHREKNNTALTDKNQRNPGGGAHSDKPDASQHQTMT